MRFEGNVVSRTVHTFDDAPFVSQAHDATRCDREALHADVATVDEALAIELDGRQPLDLFELTQLLLPIPHEHRIC